jgi:cytochrome c oxidase assembly protein subunit 15
MAEKTKAQQGAGPARSRARGGPASCEITGMHDEHRTLRGWLLASIVAVFLTLVVGGITRLTESGLSITEWQPVSGVFPPTNEADWRAAYEEFLRIPQANTTHAGITLDGFKFIYWWEWIHRFFARVVGLVFAVPYAWLLWRRRIPDGLRLRLAALPLLTLAQGVLGWYMVQSGLAGRSSVSAYRLAAHLSLALAILVVAAWTWADLRRAGETNPTPPAAPAWRRATLALVVAISVTIVTGAFVAGLRAGEIFNTFPLMGGQLVPPGYASGLGWWRGAFEHPVAAQFHHRVLAMLTAAYAVLLAWRASAASRAARGTLEPAAARAIRAVAAVALAQVALGIATLVLSVPIALGVVHQLTGALLLTVAVLALHRVRGW